MTDVTIIDYGTSNLGSMRNMLKKVGATSAFARTPEEVRAATRIILPGVGAFDAGMRGLHASGMVDALTERALHGGVPLLGVCLGMQMMGRRSEEGSLPGLGWVAADAVRFQPEGRPGMRVPHIGWNEVTPCKTSPLIAEPPDELRFYFANSFYVVCDDPASRLLQTAHAGFTFTSSIAQNNIFGAQFHPEKSHRFGMWLLKNFVERC